MPGASSSIIIHCSVSICTHDRALAIGRGKFSGPIGSRRPCDMAKVNNSKSSQKISLTHFIDGWREITRNNHILVVNNTLLLMACSSIFPKFDLGGISDVCARCYFRPLFVLTPSVLVFIVARYGNLSEENTKASFSAAHANIVSTNTMRGILINLNDTYTIARKYCCHYDFVERAHLPMMFTLRVQVPGGDGGTYAIDLPHNDSERYA